MSILEIFLYIVVLGVGIAISPLLIRRMAKQDICFTFGLTNHIKYVERGGTRQGETWEGGIFDYCIPEIPGYVLKGNTLKDMKFVKTEGEETQHLSLLNTLLYHSLGVYWYGLYPFKHIRMFQIKKEYENIQGRGPKDWIKEGKTEWVSALRFAFPRPYIFTNIELSDRLTVNLKIVLEFEVVKPYIPIYVYHGDFFTQAGSLLQSEVIDTLMLHDMDDFITSPKGELNGMLKELKDPNGEFNKKLIDLVGLRVLSISINDYQPGDDEVTEAIRKKAIAEQQGEALIMTANKTKEAELINADRDARALLVRTDAEVKSQNQLTEARANRVRATVTNLLLPNGDPNVASHGAADILEMEAATSTTSKITTLVRDRSAVTLPVGGTSR